MGVIGTLGDITFSVSTDVVNTLQNISWDSTARLPEHQKHLSEALIEFTGNDADIFSFDMSFSAFDGVNPIKEVSKLLYAKRDGRAMPLYIGTKGYGTYRWCIHKLKFKLQHYNPKGELLIATANVTLKSYARG